MQAKLDQERIESEGFETKNNLNLKDYCASCQHRLEKLTNDTKKNSLSNEKLIKYF